MESMKPVRVVIYKDENKVVDRYFVTRHELEAYVETARQLWGDDSLDD